MCNTWKTQGISSQLNVTNQCLALRQQEHKYMLPWY